MRGVQRHAVVRPLTDSHPGTESFRRPRLCLSRLNQKLGVMLAFAVPNNMLIRH